MYDLLTNDSQRTLICRHIFICYFFFFFFFLTSFPFRIVRNRGNLNENIKGNNHNNNNSSPTTSNETTTTTTPAIISGATSNEDDSRSHQTGVSSSPNGYSIHSLLNHSQYHLHSNEYSTKRSHHHHHHRSNHHIGKNPLI
jgi:hypothetical protein